MMNFFKLGTLNLFPEYEPFNVWGYKIPFL